MTWKQAHRFTVAHHLSSAASPRTAAPQSSTQQRHLSSLALHLHIACEMCLKEVPITEATIPEATDYFVHFGGLECYAKWKSQGVKPKDDAEKPVA